MPVQFPDIPNGFCPRKLNIKMQLYHRLRQVQLLRRWGREEAY